MSELIEPRIHPEVVGYAHNFYRFVEIEGQRVDRLALIREHGILSPMEARKRGVPYVRHLNIVVLGIDDYDDIIFLFPVKDRNSLPLWSGGITALIEPSLPAYSPEDMAKRYKGWVQMSSIYGGEFYVYSTIPPNQIIGFYPEESGKKGHRYA